MMEEREIIVKRGSFGSMLSGFLIGGLIGAAVALLAAPQSGEETRHMIGDKANELKHRAAEKAQETRDKAQKVIASAREGASEVVSKTKDKTSDVAEQARDMGESMNPRMS